MNRTTTATLALALSTAFAASAGAQATTQGKTTGNRFEWNGNVPAGAWIVVRNIMGPVNVTAATGKSASIVGTKRVRRGDEDYVHFVSEPLANGGILVCALWGEDSSCDEQGSHSHNDNDGRRNDTSVEFTVSLPAGVNMRAASVLGDVDVDGATAQVEASTVNGDVRARSSGGPVTASTVNGDVRASMRNVGSGDLRYSTVNGSIELELPASFSADVELRTVNGDFRTDFPMTMSGRMSPRHLEGKIGSGGRDLRATTVNGSITLRKSS
ncbi:MAG TPA: DUF4097 family beta strand repeat-containing protein [Gemmatimonadaceae bacterium]|nr:DUF4097 family beta strand repeat-containing protein [Gemmatimonadaceae bacterium]